LPQKCETLRRVSFKCGLEMCFSCCHRSGSWVDFKTFIHSRVIIQMSASVVSREK
jgi:hypothetical protein